MAPSPGSSSTWMIVSVSILASSSIVYLWHRYTLDNLERKWNQGKQAERTGRIRAEVRLRNALKQATNDGEMPLKRIGTIVSPFTKRMGTPRQGALVPASRGFVELHIPKETLEGIEQYSHAWIIFEFHVNTDLAASKKTKIRPPRGGGIKVGQLATRSPHRPNPLGLSLVKVERLDRKVNRFYISALDLVSGTPVYDIKPFVPWDLPGSFDGLPFLVPEWVSEDDSFSLVSFSPSAENDLKEALSQNLMAPLYTNDNNGFEGAIQTLKQMLAQDPRASRKRGKSTASSEPSYVIVFCRTNVEFRVTGENVVVVKVNALTLENKETFDNCSPAIV